MQENRTKFYNEEVIVVQKLYFQNLPKINFCAQLYPQ